jgi:parallel beta-helix repeat protein
LHPFRAASSPGAALLTTLPTAAAKESEMKREVLPLALLVALPVVLLGVAPAQAATKISSFGYVISAPGTYQVTQDLSGSGTAITVSADNVDLHLGGHTLSGDGSGAGVDVEGAANINIHHGTVQGFYDGIFLNGALNSKVSSVTANRNTSDGIQILNASGNTVTDTATAQNGGVGIYVNQSNGNTVTRNIVDRSYIGISVAGPSSYGNTVSRNTASGNHGAGIRVFASATQNTVQDNTCNGNFVGVQLGGDGYGGANRNTIQSNTANLNTVGIQIELDDTANTGNTLQGNTALTNANADLEDENPGCDSNIWANNTFATDLVAGGSDGGPGTGCIR